MRYFPAALERLTEQFAKLPGIGGKTAQRLAFYLLSLPEEEVAEFASVLAEAKRSVHFCPVCQNLTDRDICPICDDETRDRGLICVVGQLLISLTRLTPARILVLFVTLGVLLGALGLYAPLVDFAGAGASVPLTGFGYSLAKGAIRAARQNGVIGAFTGGITATAGGVAAAIAFGYLFSLLSRSKTKK